MEPSSEIREFLQTRRARLTPEQAGVAPHGGTRRVPGLRRTEVAQLAGVSVDYYTRLERGRAQGVSEAVLDAVARALQLDDTERTHLFDLARPTARTRRRPPSSPQRVRPVVYRLLETLERFPAMVQGRRMDVLAANRLARALYTDFDALPHRERNMARFVFLDEAARELFADWQRTAGDTVAWLRLYAGRHGDDPKLAELIGELSLHSPDFRRLWAGHNVLAHSTGTNRYHHPLVGDLTLEFEVLQVVDEPEQYLVLYSPEPASPSAETLALLGSWTGTTAAELPDREPRRTG